MKESQSIVTILVNGHAILRMLCNIQVHKKLNSDILLFQELHILIFIGFFNVADPFGDFVYNIHESQ